MACYSNAAVRFNPGIGAGHHEKVVTAGKKTRFWVESYYQCLKNNGVN